MRVRLVPALIALALVGGCKEIGARRKIQEANDQYKNGRYETARRLYEEALEDAPDLAIGHHNLGVTLYKLTKKGDTSPENKAMADNAAQHLQIYLKSAPHDEDVKKLITEIWTDTDQSEKAVAFWTSEHEAAKDQLFPIEQLAELTFKKGDWREAIKWLEKGVDIAATPEDKAKAYTKIGSLCFVLLLKNKDDGLMLDGAQRIEIGDIGIAALQKGQALAPSSTEIVSVLGSLNVQRGIANRSRIGYSIDMAAHQNYMRIFGVLREEALKAKALEGANPPKQGT